jgi:hypothetical protein
MFALRPALGSPFRICILVTGALVVSACAPIHSSPSSAKENAAMTVETSAVAESAALSAQDISKRVLAMIESIRNVGDLSPEAIEKHTGLKVSINPDDRNDYGVTGKLTDEWYYGLRSMSAEPGKTPNRLIFQFNDQTHADADMSPVCVPFEDYDQALTAAGFTAKRQRNRLNTEDYWDFSRGDIGVSVYLRGKSGPKDTQTCVSMLIINAYA